MSNSTGEERIRRGLVASLAALLVMVLSAAAIYWLLPDTGAQPAIVEQPLTGPKVAAARSVRIPKTAFTDITDEANIGFVHVNGAYGERLLPETMGGGVAFLDYDNDGDQDIFFVNSGHWPWREEAASQPTAKLYRNRGDGSFDDVTEATGLDIRLYGMGVAAGDYDGDGFVDLFVTAVGENRLLKNVGGSRFIDVTQQLRVSGSDQDWSTSAAFFDFDQDGDLDLFVGNYVAWSPEIDRTVDYRLAGVGRAYGPPTDFSGAHSYLYRNDLDAGVFTDVSKSAGIAITNAASGSPAGKALAVHAVDVTGDGWLDLIVANDTVRNFLFINERNGRFRESGIDAGLAFSSAGLATGAMGVDAAHYANDERLAVLIGNFANEMSSFYVTRQADAIFSDDAIAAGIGAPSRRALTFGLLFADLDLDGRLDVLAANGHVEPQINQVQSSQHYEQPVQLFWNCGSACRKDFAEVKQTIGRPVVGRGAAYADIDNDGDLDVIITQVGGKPMLLRNDQAFGHSWIRLALRSNGANRYAIGAKVVLTSGGVSQTRQVMPGRSYLSQVELPLTFGLGSAAPAAVTAEVVWPDGQRERWVGLKVNGEHLLVQGESP